MVSSSYRFSADFIRALAIFLVIVVHVSADYLSKVTVFSSFMWWLVISAETISKIAVPLFIMLSGQLILDTNKNYTLDYFYKKRLSKIGIPILFWPFFYYFGFLLLKRVPFQLVAFLNSYLFLNTFYHLYFLFIIFGLYLFAPFIKTLIKHTPKTEIHFLTITILLLASLMTPLVYFLPTKITYWSIFTVSIPFMGYFIAGHILGEKKLSQLDKKKATILFLISSVLLVLAKYFAFENHFVLLQKYLEDVLNIGTIVASLSAFTLLNNFASSYSVKISERVKKFILSLSATSFGIYIIHPLFIFAYSLVQGAGTLPEIIGPNSILGMSVKILVVLSLSFIVVIVAQKSRFTKIFFGS